MDEPFWEDPLSLWLGVLSEEPDSCATAVAAGAGTRDFFFVPACWPALFGVTAGTGGTGTTKSNQGPDNAGAPSHHSAPSSSNKPASHDGAAA